MLLNGAGTAARQGRGPGPTGRQITPLEDYGTIRKITYQPGPETPGPRASVTHAGTRLPNRLSACTRGACHLARPYHRRLQ
ncbi:protein of unknown function [Pararobbsia alpina]